LSVNDSANAFPAAPPAIGGMNGSVPQNPISGVNIPEFGMPRTSTTVGINGPTYLPAGSGAGKAPRAQQILTPPQSVVH